MSSFYSHKKDISDENKKEAKIILENAIKFYEQGNFIEAKKLFLDAIGLDYTLALAYSKLAELYLKTGHIYSAKEILEITLDLNHNIYDIYKNLGIIYFKEGKIQKSIIFLEKYLIYNPNDIDTIKNLALCYEDYDIDKFNFFIEKAVNLGDKDAEQHLTQKELENLFNNSNYNKIIELFNDILLKQKSYTFLSLVIYARSLKKIEKYDTSLLMLYKALERIDIYQIKDKFYFLYLLLGMVYAHLEQFQRAEELIYYSYSLYPEACRDFIINEKDLLVKINDYGYPYIDNKVSIIFNQEQLNRKIYSEKILLEKGINISKDLPCLETEEKINFRTLPEITERLLALTAISLKASGDEIAFLLFMNKFEPKQYMTKNEKYFLGVKKSDIYIRELFLLNFEAIELFLWVLGYKDLKLDFYNLSNRNEIINLLNILGSKERIISESLFKNKKDILDKADLFYRLNYFCLKSKNEIVSNNNINIDKIHIINKAFNWLINFQKLDWEFIN
ncbi:MAG: DUF4272 domain-containing protein [Candidatus Sericytochromatia bacterium]